MSNKKCAIFAVVPRLWVELAEAEMVLSRVQI